MAGKFSLDLAKFGATTMDKADKAFRSICLGIGTGIIDRTPYDTGRARNSWESFLNSASFSAGGQPDGAYPESGDVSKSKLARVTGGGMLLAGKDVVFYFGNNLPYIVPLETGHSQQAPGGMVRVTISEFPGVAQQAVNRARGGGGVSY